MPLIHSASLTLPCTHITAQSHAKVYKRPANPEGTLSVSCFTSSRVRVSTRVYEGAVLNIS